jgi:hypothetical protein
MAASGRLVDWTGTHDCKFLVHSSCKITKVLLVIFFPSYLLTVEVNSCITMSQLPYDLLDYK